MIAEACNPDTMKAKIVGSWVQDHPGVIVRFYLQNIKKGIRVRVAGMHVV